MRVVVVSRGDLVHTVPFLDAMVSRGWDVHLAALSPSGQSRRDVSIHPCYLNSISSKPLNYAHGVHRLRQITQRLKPNFVWAHYASSAGTVAWLAGYRPYCITAHGSDVLDVTRRWAGRTLMRRVLGGAGCVHTVSTEIARRVEQLGVDKNQTITAPFGIDLAQLPFQFSKFHDPPRLVCTRSLQYDVYDIPTILRAVERLWDRGNPVELTLCGRGQLQSRLQRLADELGIENHVRFLGGYDHGELAAILQGHDIYVSSSLSDGASLSLMEAMAAGIFPIVSDIHANRDWIEDPASLFPVGDFTGLANRIEEAIGRQDVLLPMVQRNRDVVERQGDRSRNIHLIVDHMERLGQ